LFIMHFWKKCVLKNNESFAKFIFIMSALEEDDLDRYNSNPIINTQTTIGGFNRSFIGKF